MPQIMCRKAALGALGAVLLCPILTGCSGDGDEPSGGPSGSPTAAAEFTVSAKAGKVSGKLGKAARDTVVDDVSAVVQSWMETAYLDGSAPDLDTAFTDFTTDAAALAVRQSAITSNAKFDGAAGVTPRPGKVTVDILAPRGRVSGATARVRLAMDVAEDDATEQVNGSLFLTKVKGKWRVFGFDLDRGQKAGAK